MQQNEQSHFYHRRPIVTLAGKHQEKTNHNVGTRKEKTDHNVSNAHPCSSWWQEEEEVAVAVDAVASTADTVVVAEEDRTTLVPGRWLRVVSVLHLVSMCLIMDTGQPQIRWELHGKACAVCGYKLWTGHKQWATENNIPVILSEPVHTCFWSLG
jgi:hypothetical protein